MLPSYRSSYGKCKVFVIQGHLKDFYISLEDLVLWLVYYKIYHIIRLIWMKMLPQRYGRILTKIVNFNIHFTMASPRMPTTQNGCDPWKQ